jgi:hypothetical protein
MSVWDWVDDFRREAHVRGDEDRLRLLALHSAAQGRIDHEPEAALDRLRDARALAAQLDEPWWVLLTDHWKLQVLLHYTFDFREVLDLAVRATLEARKPEYAHLPQRVCLHEDLVYAYVGIDPAGHADAIRQALDFMRGQAGDDLECRYCVQNCATEFHLRCGRTDEAAASARRALEMADADARSGEHHAVYARCDLCEIAHRRQDWEALRDESAAGEELARRCDNARKLAEFLVWEALLARRDGDEAGARRLVRQAAARLATTRALPSAAVHDALCAYHEAGGDLAAALKARTRELEATAGKGRLFHECRVRVERCRLLARLGQPPADDLAEARAAAARLRDPAPWLEQLARIEAGPA